MKIDFEKILSQHKYCFICKGNLVKKGVNFLQCDSCGYRTFINPGPTSGVILENENGEILLAERGMDPAKGLWDFPGGFIDMGENAEDAAIRELKEELGITAVDLKYFASFSDEYLFDGIIIPSLTLFYVGKLGNEKITPGDDVSGYKFFKLSEIPLDKLAFENTREALEKYINDHK